MVKTISIHSFRGGTGKSNTTANLSSMLTRRVFASVLLIPTFSRGAFTFFLG